MPDQKAGESQSRVRPSEKHSFRLLLRISGCLLKAMQTKLQAWEIDQSCSVLYLHRERRKEGGREREKGTSWRLQWLHHAETTSCTDWVTAIPSRASSINPPPIHPPLLKNGGGGQDSLLKENIALLNCQCKTLTHCSMISWTLLTDLVPHTAEFWK